MKRRVAMLLAAVIVLLAAGAGVGTWLLVHQSGPGTRYPMISAYSNGHLTRVGPYLYCNALNLNECHEPQTQGELRVSERYPVQLSVPEAIARAPWILLRNYEDPTNDVTTVFRPNTRLAVTIPTVDPQRGRLTGVVVQLLTRVVYNGEDQYPPHAEWSVRLSYSQ